MKKPYLLFGFLIGLLIVSCSSDDDNENNSTASIIGNWNLIERDGNSNITCSFTLNITDTDITENESFGPDCAGFESSTSPYTLNGNTVTLQTDIGNFVTTITSLTDTLLEWESNDPDTNDLNVSTFERIE